MSLSKARRGLLQRLTRRKQRRREGCFLVEGIRCCGAALAADLPTRFAVTSSRLRELETGVLLADRLDRASFDVVEIDDGDLEDLAGTVTPQGVLMVGEEPTATLDELGAEVRSLLVADAVQDPGNLGSMIRTAAALGLGGLVVLDGTVDPWNAKVVRGSAGASFRLPVIQAGCAETIEWLADSGFRLLAADPEGARAAAVDKTLPWALAIGNEGAGLRPELRAAAAATVAVPLHPPSDSLNAGVAAAILCYELNRENAT